MDRRAQMDLEDQERAREMQEAGVSPRGLPPEKRYRVDPDFSRRPTAICELTTIGLPNCGKGEGKYCMYRKPCSHQLMFDGETRYPHAEKLYQAEAAAALKHAREVSDIDHSFEEIDWDAMQQEMTSAGDEEKRIKGGRG